MQDVLHTAAGGGREPAYLDALNPEQKAAVVHSGSPLLILAGAGSGKTRVITTKIAYLISETCCDPRSILAVTFTKKAASEMAFRARLLEPRAQYTQIRTFHSFGAWFLRLFAEAAGIDPHFTVYDEDDMASLLTAARPGLLRKEAAHMAQYISRVKDYCLDSDAGDFSPVHVPRQFADIYALYEQELRKTGNVDFGDLIMLPLLVLRENSAVRARMHERFRVIMVDEYQDSNVAQFLLLQQLAGPDTYVCVVGDDDQSIYRFRGAEIGNILSFEKQFPGTQIVRLERNYRSVKPVLDIADAVIAHNTARLGKTLRAERSGGKEPVLAFLPDQEEEAAYCAELIERSHKKGCPYADWAVLYRTNAQSLSFETELLHRKIPYTVVGSLKFYEREEIRDMLAFLKFIANPRDTVSFARIVNKPARGVGKAAQAKILAYLSAAAQAAEPEVRGCLDACRAALGELSSQARKAVSEFAALVDELRAELSLQKDGIPLAGRLARDAEEASAEEEQPEARLSVFIQTVAERSGLLEHYIDKDKNDEKKQRHRELNILEFINSALLYPYSFSGLLDFLDHIKLDRTPETEQGDAPDAVSLITLHNTKGLEFERVVITGLEEGVFPRSDKRG
ncbi:MAG TPA: ATP-dependent helicase, partial [Candidatus Treponema faecavium]|nr:ATP-dependent helicase [Candidatus Treponema faecavium]